MKLIIEILNGRLSGKTFIVDSFPISIGRLSSSNLQIQFDKYISRAHCTIYKDGNNLYLIDLKSTNGTYVNDQLIQSSVGIKNEDIIRIGNTNFKCSIDQSV
jgi:pSer/pThr/pTyr-binding forkhead associated (FHA) protein